MQDPAKVWLSSAICCPQRKHIRSRASRNAAARKAERHVRSIPTAAKKTPPRNAVCQGCWSRKIMLPTATVNGTPTSTPSAAEVAKAIQVNGRQNISLSAASASAPRILPTKVFGLGFCDIKRYAKAIPITSAYQSSRDV